MRNILVICGPTATGKTKIALNLAKKIDGEIISADSRQIYVGLDIGTGKDLPCGSKNELSKIKHDSRLIKYYLVNGVKLWGYDLIGPKDKFSVDDYTKCVKKIIVDIYSRDKTPILVGGTGLYIRAILDGIETSSIPPDEKLRRLLNRKSIVELQDILRVENSEKLTSLNQSDSMNPRRLVRAIEISRSNVRKNNQSFKFDNVLMIGLFTNNTVLGERIKKRVESRIAGGLEDEIKSLLNLGVSWDSQSMTSLGYSQWRSYFDEGIDKNRVIESWITAEKRYSKRQMTWFNNDKRINWYDISDRYYRDKVATRVDKWYKELR